MNDSMAYNLVVWFVEKHCWVCRAAAMDIIQTMQKCCPIFINCVFFLSRVGYELMLVSNTRTHKIFALSEIKSGWNWIQFFCRGWEPDPVDFHPDRPFWIREEWSRPILVPWKNCIAECCIKIARVGPKINNSNISGLFWMIKVVKFAKAKDHLYCVSWVVSKEAIYSGLSVLL